MRDVLLMTEDLEHFHTYQVDDYDDLKKAVRHFAAKCKMDVGRVCRVFYSFNSETKMFRFKVVKLENLQYPQVQGLRFDDGSLIQHSRNIIDRTHDMAA